MPHTWSESMFFLVSSNMGSLVSHFHIHAKVSVIGYLHHPRNLQEGTQQFSSDSDPNVLFPQNGLSDKHKDYTTHLNMRFILHSSPFIISPWITLPYPFMPDEPSVLPWSFLLPSPNLEVHVLLFSPLCLSSQFFLSHKFQLKVRHLSEEDHCFLIHILILPSLLYPLFSVHIHISREAKQTIFEIKLLCPMQDSHVFNMWNSRQSLHFCQLQHLLWVRLQFFYYVWVLYLPTTFRSPLLSLTS
jgi:hypothetical protein